MGYVQKVLQPGETLRFRTNHHWIAYGPGVGLLLLAVFLLAGAEQPNAWRGVWTILALIACAGAAILLARAWFVRWITEIAVTDRRIIYKSGFIRRHTDEMPLGKVENVEVTQWILGRLLGYGDVRVEGSGGGGIGRLGEADRESKRPALRNIASPLEFRSHVLAGS